MPTTVADHAGAAACLGPGVAAPLLRLLQLGPQQQGAHHAAAALSGLTASRGGAEDVAACGGAAALLATLDGSWPAACMQHALTALGNLAACAEGRAAMASEAARALANLALGDDGSRLTRCRHRSLGADRAEQGDDTSEKKARYPAHEVTWRASKGAQLYNTPVRRAVHTGPWLPGGTSPAKARPPSASSTARSSGVATQAATSRGRQRAHMEPHAAHYASGIPVPGLPSSGTGRSVRRLADVIDTAIINHLLNSHTRRGEATESPIEDVVKALRTDGQRGWSKPLWAAGAIASQQLTNQEKDAYRRAGAIPLLVQLLETGPEMDVCRLSCAALSQLAHNHTANCEAILDAGGLQMLTHVIAQARHYGEVAQWATCALTQLTFKQADACAALLAAGAIPSLIAVVRHQREEDTRVNALRVLCNLAHMPQACEEIRHANALPILVSQLNSGFGSESTVVAARTLLNMACNDSEPDAILEAGGIQGLTKLLGADPQADVTMVVCLALTQLALRSDRASGAIAECRGIDRLLRLLRAGAGADIFRVALGTLLNLSNNPRNCDMVREAGGIPELVRLLKSPQTNKATELQAARVLSNLALNQDNSGAIRAAGGIQPFVALLAGPLDADVVRVAAVALSQLSFESPANKDAILQAGGIPALVRLLGAERSETCKWAACALAELAFNSNTAAAAIRSAGGVSQMVALLKGGADLDVAVQVVRGLANLALNPGNQDDIREQGAVPNIVGLLQHQEADDNAVVVAACALAEMAFGNLRNSEAIHEAGGLEQLLRVASCRYEASILWQVVRAVAELTAVPSAATRRAVAAHEAQAGTFSTLAAVDRAQPEVAAQARRVLAHLQEPHPVSPPRSQPHAQYAYRPPVAAWSEPAPTAAERAPASDPASRISHAAADGVPREWEAEGDGVRRALDYGHAHDHLPGGLVPYQPRPPAR
eukprot:jgi/Tetstr1/443206/TSEL_031246.t1